jgi:RecB family exonuclease
MQLTWFDDAVRSASERLSLTAPRVSLEGSTRQPAAVLLDVMRALSGSNADLEKKLENAAAAGRIRERAVRERCPISISATLDCIARGDIAAARTETNPALALDALRAIRDRVAPTAQDGLLGGVIPLSSIAGIGPDRPISPSRLSTLVSCPHRFLYEHILGFREPEGPLRTHSLDVMRFGTWLHGIAEEFWKDNGAALGNREGDLSTFQERLRALAAARFEELQQTYPFANDLVAHAEREALCDQLNKLLTLDWNDAQPQTFVAVERAFGYDGQCQIETDAGPLYVRGKIDKLDRDGDTLLVRDIKTGTGKPRRADDLPDPGIDLQVAVYALAAKRMAQEWNTPEQVAVAYMYLRSGESDRSWRGTDYAILERAAKGWLATAKQVLEQGAFARSPIEEDCKYCAHKPVCAPEMHRAEAVLEDPRVPRRLKLLKLPEES